jgi:hypothetical protein
MSKYTTSENYVNLLRNITTIVNNRVTEDWVEEQKKYIFEYREMFPDFDFLHPEIEDQTFRTACGSAEILMNNLLDSLMQEGTFSLETYSKFLHTFMQIASIWISDEEMNECVKKLSI